MPGTLLAALSQPSPFLALSFLDVVWGLLAVVVFFLGLLLIVIILFQESKDAGLTSAFGGAGGGSALLGARMQKGLAKMTAVLAIVFALCVTAMGIIGNSMLHETIAGSGGAPAGAGADAPAGEAPEEDPGVGNLPEGDAAPGGGQAGGAGNDGGQ